MNRITKTNDTLVSICCAAYNQESYIGQCIDSFVKQITTFRFEILIHDDASTDNTAAIIKKYEQQYPDLIKPIYQIENQYSKGIKITPEIQFPRSKGKYLAHCEGDDYWTDPFKLQKQVDFMESNPDYGLVYSKVIYYYQEKNKFSRKSWGGPAIEFNELIEGNKIPTLTTLFRSELFGQYLKEIRPEIHNWKMGDYPIWLFMSLKSKIFFMDEVSGVYRVLNESVSHSSDFNKLEQFCKSYFDIKVFFHLYGNIAFDKQKMNDALLSRLATNALLLNKPKASLDYLDLIKSPRKIDQIKKVICKSSFLIWIYNKMYSNIEG